MPDDELEKGAVVELLGAPEGEGRQFIVPPSRHRSKGSYVFFGTFEISRIVRLDPAELLRKVRHLGAAALIAEEIRQGGRHELSLHISRQLLNEGMRPEDVEHIVTAAWEVRGGDVSAARRNVWDTLKRKEAGKNFKRSPDEEAPGLADALRKALDLKPPKSGRGFVANDLVTLGEALTDELFVDQYKQPYALYQGRSLPVDELGDILAVEWWKQTGNVIGPETKKTALEHLRRRSSTLSLARV